MALLQRAARRCAVLAAALRDAAMEASGVDDSACCQLRIDVPGTSLHPLHLRLRSQECGAALYAAVRVQLLQHAMGDEHSAVVALQELVRSLQELVLQACFRRDAYCSCHEMRTHAATTALSNRRMQPRFLAAWC